MNTVCRELAERIRGEVSDLERLIQRVLQSWEGGQRSPDQQDVYLDSVALNLHGFYSWVERLFELIVRHVDRDLDLATGGLPSTVVGPRSVVTGNSKFEIGQSAAGPHRW